MSLSNFTDCPICFNMYDMITHQPMSIQCTHSLCLSCLQKLRCADLISNIVTCPFCRSKVNRRNSIMNRALCEIIQHLKKEKGFSEVDHQITQVSPIHNMIDVNKSDESLDPIDTNQPFQALVNILVSKVQDSTDSDSYRNHFIQAVIRGMNKHLDILSYQVDACDFLCKYSEVHSIDIECINSILNATRKHVHSVPLLQRAFRVIFNITVFDSYEIKITSLGGIDAILIGMNHHLDNTFLQEEACRALQNLSYDESTGNKIASIGGIQTIIKCMQQHLYNESIQQSACRILYNITCYDYCYDSNKNNFQMVESIEEIIRCMQQYPNNVSIQQDVCGALRNLSVDDSAEIKIGMIGGIEGIVNSMNQYPYDPSIQEDACGALRNLSFSQLNCRLISNVGGIEAMTNGMKQHPDNEEIRVDSCDALVNVFRSYQ